MEREVGIVLRDIRCSTIREGDNLVEIAVNDVLEAGANEGFEIRDRDVISVTESMVARARGNYASTQAISEGMKAKLGGGTIGAIFPVPSRNHLPICLKGIAGDAREIVLMLGYLSDEVGNSLVSLDQVDEAGINPYNDMPTLECYWELSGENEHEFTGVDYVDYYCQIIREAGMEAKVTFVNNPGEILNHTKRALTCDIHPHAGIKRILKKAGAEMACGMDDILNAPVNDSGYNEKYGSLGSSKSIKDNVKLFPRECMDLALDIQEQTLDKTRKHIEVIVHGDRAFKDPVGKVWELADSCVAAASTEGLRRTPSEAKLKYLADNDSKDLSGEILKNATSQKIKEKRSNLTGDMSSQGTTPRRLTDLTGSLCDLTSGSSDKSTPAILVQGCFNNYTDQSSVSQ